MSEKRWTPPGGGWILTATILGSSMAFIDGTAVNVALPALQRDLGATVSDAQWVVEAYALLLAALILVGGSLGDHFGRRRVFCLGIGVFALASAWCGLSPGVGWLIAARALQGAGAALLVPGSLALLSASFPEEVRGRAIGTWSALTGVTAAVGPLVGGWLVDHASWRWVFFLNAPLAAAVVAIALLRVPESSDPEAARGLDLAGTLLATAGLAGVTFGLLELPGQGPAQSLAPFALGGGVAALGGFLLVEARVKEPMMPLSLFGSRTFAGANLLTLWLYGALSAALFFVPFDLIQVRHYSALAAGAALLPMVILISLLSRWAGGLVDRLGPRLPLMAGPAIAATGFLLFSLPGTDGSYWTTCLPAFSLLGLGLAVSVAPLTTTVMGAVEIRHSGLASGINNAVSRVAGLLAVAAFGLLVLAVFNHRLDRRLAALGLPPAALAALSAERNRLAAATIPPALSGEQRERTRAALDDSFSDAFRVAMVAAAGLALAASLSGATLIGRDVRAGPPGRAAGAPGNHRPV